MGSTSAISLGSTVSASLPNITGSSGIGMWNTGVNAFTYNHGINWMDLSGSFYTKPSSSTINNWTETIGTNKTSWSSIAERLSIDASRSSEVYSDSTDTVIVDSLKVAFCIRY